MNNSKTTVSKFYIEERLYSPNEICADQGEFELSLNNPFDSFQLMECTFKKLLFFFREIIFEYQSSHPEYYPVSFEELVIKYETEKRENKNIEKSRRPWWRRIFN